MKKKILIIFFLTLIPLYIIYKYNHKESYIYLSIGDELSIGHTPFNTYNLSYIDYLFDYLKLHNNNVTLIKEELKEDIRINDLIKEIENINENSLNSYIKKSNLITISIGSEEIFNKLKVNYDLYINNPKLFYTYIDTLYNDYKLLLNKITKITNSKIYIIGYYNPILTDNLTLFFNYINSKFSTLETKNIKYIEIYNGFINNPSYLPNPSHTYPSLEGYKYISNEIIKELTNN